MSDADLTAHALWRLSKRVLAAHFENCPRGCTETHIQCSLGDTLVKAEDRAFWAAKAESLPPSPPYWARPDNATALPGFETVAPKPAERRYPG